MRAFYEYLARKWDSSNSQLLIAGAKREQQAFHVDLDEVLSEGKKLSVAESHARALVYFERAIEIAPESSHAYLLAGNEAFATGDFETAKDYFFLSRHYGPADPEASLGLARVFRETGQSDRAIGLCRKLLLDFPEHWDTWFELARCQHTSFYFGDAIESLRHVLWHDSSDSRALNYLGLILARELGELSAGEENLRLALKYSPGMVATWSNLGWVQSEQGRVEEGMAYFDKVLEADPEDQETRLMRAHANLKNGNFSEGWSDFFARHGSTLATASRYGFPEMPLQLSAMQKKVLIYAEQGLGDQIMFASCIPDFLAAGGQAVLGCDIKLEKLFRRSFPDCIVIADGPSLMSTGPHIPPNVEWQMPIGNLPCRFRTRLQNFPNHDGYLQADADKMAFWRKRLALTGDGPYVGVSWRGGVKTTRRQLRSVPLLEWGPILEQPGQFVNLQYDECHSDLAEAEHAGFRIHHWPEALADYDDTAALVAALDVVISVCTAVVHLGGALGKPVWVLTPAVAEWRYLAQGDSMPWYPSVKLFRQPYESGWASVVNTVARALTDLRWDCPN